MRALRDIVTALTQIATIGMKLVGDLQSLHAMQRSLSDIQYELNLIRRRLDQPFQSETIYPDVGPAGVVVSDVSMADSDDIWRRKPLVEQDA